MKQLEKLNRTIAMTQTRNIKAVKELLPEKCPIKAVCDFFPQTSYPLQTGLKHRNTDML